LAAAQALEQVCTKFETFLGRWNRTTFGCFMAGADRNQCLDLAQSIRQNLALRKKGTTVSVGIALFPTVNFTRQQILANALKALDHAAFFGADSTVPFDAVTLNVSGDRLYQHNDVVGAIRELKTALMLDPSNVNVHNSLGVCYAEKKAWDLAREAFETARWLDPLDPMAVYNLGLIHMLQNQTDEALDYFRKAVETDAEMFEALVQMGRLLLQENQAAEALGCLERAAELNPQNAPCQRFLGQCLERLGQADGAIKAYRRAVKLNPHDAASLSALGYLLDQAGENLEISILFCKQGVELAPTEGLYRHRLGRLYLKDGRRQDALAQFEKALELGHDSKAQIKELKSQKMPQNE
ncbi:MAG: tetratricopeptide repeat protein, partial [Desulfobacterales bacterium]